MYSEGWNTYLDDIRPKVKTNNRVSNCGKYSGDPKTGRIKTLLLRRKNDWYGTCFGMLQQPLWPATAVAAIDEKRTPQ